MATPDGPPISSTFEGEEKKRYEETSFDAEVASNALRLRGRKLTFSIAFVAGAGFTLFGYDQGVMSALLTAGQVCFFVVAVYVSNESQSLKLFSMYLHAQEIGCLMGALSNLWVGDRLGRRRTIVLGGCIMIIGAILQTTSYSYAQLVVARIFTGIGNGLNTSTVPSYHAELSSAAKRGALICIEGSLITFGWIDFGLFWASGSSAQWRVPIALQIVLALVMVFGIGFLPESPRWLVKQNRNAEAVAVISALENKPPGDAEVQRTYHAIREAVAIEDIVTSSGLGGKQNIKRSPLRKLLVGGRSQHFRRASLGVIIHIYLYYKSMTILFQRLGLSDVTSRLIAAANGTEYFLASIIAIFIIDRIGRRKLMIFGAVGQCITMILLAVLGSVRGTGAQVVSALLLFVFNSFFAIGWLGMTWLYPAEIVGLEIRAPANALSTSSNWIFNFVVVMVTGPSFNNISWGTYIVFAALNALIIPVVYFFFPETAGRSLEDMDVVFALAYNEGVSPVGVSLRKDIPLAGSPEADRILGIETIDGKVDTPRKTS
ncbi:general substrate transporter [Suillus spraguei]|nr:general substrate transporter [Suillus spraguei]